MPRVHGHSSSSTPAAYGQDTLADDGVSFYGLYQDDAGHFWSFVMATSTGGTLTMIPSGSIRGRAEVVV